MSREARTVADRDADRQVARALQGREGKATVGDLVVATGIPEHQVRRSVERLLDDYESSVAVAKGGELVYRFTVGALGLKPRRERRRLLAAMVRATATAMTALVTALRAAFRAVLAVQLLLYLVILLAPLSVVIGVVLGVVLLVMGIIAAISDGGDIGGLLELLFEPYVLIAVFIGCALYGTFLVFSKKVEILMALVGKHEGGGKGILGFIGQVNDFALGPEKPPTRAERIDRAWTVSQPDEQRVLARIRAQGGRLRAGDLVAWLGLDLEEAERQAARIAVEYGGEPSATDLDIVEFELKLLMKTAERKGDDTVSPKEPTTHERGIELPRLTGNRPSEDFVIACFAGANLAGGLLAGRWLAGKAATAATHAGWWAFGHKVLGTVPVGFALLVFGLVVVRVPWFGVSTWWRRRRQLAASVHKAIVEHVRRKGSETLDLTKLAARLGAGDQQVREIAVGLDGQFDLEGDAERTVWRWRRLAHELQRKRAKAEVAEASVDEDEGEAGLGD